MVELDGQRRTPDFFVPYVSFIVLGTILTPLVALGFLIKEGETDVGLSTLGVYLLCLVVQIASESFTLRKGVCPLLFVHPDCSVSFVHSIFIAIYGCSAQGLIHQPWCDVLGEILLWRPLLLSLLLLQIWFSTNVGMAQSGLRHVLVHCATLNFLKHQTHGMSEDRDGCHRHTTLGLCDAKSSCRCPALQH